MASAFDRVVVVTGGATGIGAAIAEELGRAGAFVVTLDANVSLDGSSALTSAGPSTADRIVAAGGAARSVSLSVTDADGVRALFEGLATEFGTIHAVVNAAGISRPTSFAAGDERDWDAVLAVHLDGYLNVLRAALAIMARSGHGSVVGLTSGSGWRAANTGAYGCAKRAVAALTWQLGRVVPSGITVTALSPIAATRMVTASLARGPDATTEAAQRATTGGISLTGFPPPEHLGPVGAFLAGDGMEWCSGKIFFSAGAEIALVAEPQLLEVVRTRPTTALPAVLDEVFPRAFVPAEESQSTGGGSMARFANLFDEHADEHADERTGEPAGDVVAHRQGSNCVVVTDDAGTSTELTAALVSSGARCVSAGAPADGFAQVAEQLRRSIEGLGRVDAVVLATGSSGLTPIDRADSHEWERTLAEHAGLARRIRNDAAWARAVAEHAIASQHPVRLVVLTDATTAGGRSRAQAIAQLSRAARGATDGLVAACAVSCESDDELDRVAVAEVAAHLAVHPGNEQLSGAELCIGRGWVGLRSHPRPVGTVSYGGPALPTWVGPAVELLVTGEFPEPREES